MHIGYSQLLVQSLLKAYVNNSYRRLKIKSLDLDLFDRISALPDSILGIILSFIPTKNAVASAVLSKRWKFVWTTVPNLDLCYEDRLGKRDDMRFVRFVNRVLLLHDFGWLNKFRLVWTPRCISSRATSWINTAISKNVRELFLRLETHSLVQPPHFSEIPSVSLEPFVMPIRVFSCETLRFLELDCGVISVYESIVVCLPRLETLRLFSVYFQSEEAFKNLISGCPMLSDLFILMRNGMLPDFIQDDDFTYIISSTSLRRFQLNLEYFTDYINLELDAASLEYLTIEGFIPVFLRQKSLSSLVEAKLNIDMPECLFSDADTCNLVVEAVRVFNCAKALILSAGVIWALSCATISLSTEFKRLMKLETETYYCYCSSLRDFIQYSDNLEVLTMDQHSTRNEIDDTSWTPPVQVPRCLSNSLKKIVLRNYCGGWDEREMIRYMLKHGSALEVIVLSCYRGRENRFQEICEF